MTGDDHTRQTGTKEQLVARSVLDAALDAVVVIDTSGAIVEWNTAATTMFGFDRAAAVGSQLGDLIVPEDQRVAHLVGLERCVATGEGPMLNTRVAVAARHADGSTVKVEMKVTPTTDDAGTVRFTGWLRDVGEREDVERRAAESESRLATLLANISDIITVLGPSGAWISTSGAGSRMLGWDPGLDPEGGIFGLLHPDDVEPALIAFREVIEGTRTSAEPIDLRVMDAAGMYHVLETVAEDLTDDPAVGGVVLTSRDVTASRDAQAETQELTAQLTTLVSSLSDGVLFVDDQRKIVLVNRAFADIFDVDEPEHRLRGRPAKEMRTSSPSPFADSEDAEAIIERRYGESEPTYDELVTMTDGRVLERDSIPVRFANARPGHLWVYRDVTAREELARQRADLLEDSRAARDLVEQQNQALLELAEMRSQFVATVSHELRTPLTSIVSFSDLLRGDLDAEGWEEQREFVEAIDRNAKRLLRLVNDLLMLRRIESGILPMEMSTGPMSTLVHGAVHALGPLAADKHQQLEVSVGDGPDITGDLGRIDQVLVNLLSNAVKFTPDGGVVRVDASCDGTTWHIVVSDNGIGIPADEQKHLFEQFYRGSNAPDRPPGTGLGLVISKAVIERHHGSITVESEADTGTVVTVRLPIGARPDD